MRAGPGTVRSSDPDGSWPSRLRDCPRTSPRLRLPDDVGVPAFQRLVAIQAAVARARQGGVRAAAAVREDRVAAAADVLGVLVAVPGLALLLGKLGLGADVHAPAGQPR